MTDELQATVWLGTAECTVIGSRKSVEIIVGKLVAECGARGGNVHARAIEAIRPTDTTDFGAIRATHERSQSALSPSYG